MVNKPSTHTVADGFHELKRLFFVSQINYFRQYLETVDNHLEAKRSEVQDKVHGHNEININSTFASSREELISRRREVAAWQGFMNLFRQSFVVFLYSFFEASLLRECNVRGRKLSIGVDTEEVFRNWKRVSICDKIEKFYQEYLPGDYEFNFDTVEWKWIKDFAKLRNCIVHQQGDLSGLRVLEIELAEELKDFILEEDGLSLIDRREGLIFIKHDFCVKAIQNTDIVLSSLIFS
jgi:hypothetical protein